MRSLIKSKPAQLGVVIFLVACILGTGAYAWNGFFGSATLATPSVVPDEVTLYDFSSQLGEIYVVNNDNQPMLVRVKFLNNLLVNGASLIPGALPDDPSTWQTDNPALREYYRPVLSKAVLPMGEWKAAGAPVGDYWVADEGGWYYYARKLAPGEATRTLFTEIAENQFNVLVDGEYQTATFLQSVTEADLGDLLRLDTASFTSDGRLLMRYLSGELVELVP